MKSRWCFCRDRTNLLLILTLIIAAITTADTSPTTLGLDLSVPSTIDVVLSNAVALSAFEFWVEYDAAVVSALSISRGTAWEGYLFHSGKIDNDAGVIAFTSGAIALDTGPGSISAGSDGLILATIEFEFKTMGTSHVVVDGFLCDTNGDRITVEITGCTLSNQLGAGRSPVRVE